MPKSLKKLRSNRAWIERHINDPFVKMSRAQGYRARSAFKLLEIDEKAMAYCLVEALFAAGVINLPTYQNFLRMKREQEEEPPAKAS